MASVLQCLALMAKFSHFAQLTDISDFHMKNFGIRLGHILYQKDKSENMVALAYAAVLAAAVLAGLACLPKSLVGGSMESTSEVQLLSKGLFVGVTPPAEGPQKKGHYGCNTEAGGVLLTS
eukprot:symbB.v1.2.014717.t1/scaffold1080.1/size139481/13